VIGPFRTGASSVTFAQPVRATHRARSPGRLITSKAPKGRPFCGSDRVSETLHAPYQRKEHAARIITAVLCAPEIDRRAVVMCAGCGRVRRSIERMGAEFPFVCFRPPRFGSKLLAGGSDGVGDMRAALPHRLIGSSRGIAFGLAFELGVHGGTKEHGVGREVQPEQ
jgi:hypothetical protein